MNEKYNNKQKIHYLKKQLHLKSNQSDSFQKRVVNQSNVLPAAQERNHHNKALKQNLLWKPIILIQASTLEVTMVKVY
jgi:hypothetical protein